MSNLGLRKITKTVGKNSPTILTGLGVLGLVGTTIMAVKATPKALMLIEHEEMEENRILEPKEIIQLTWKCYLPALGMGVITAACIIGANKINVKRNAALVSVYSLSQAALKEYQAKVVEHIGIKKETQVREAIAKDKIEKNPVSDNKIILTGNGKTLCYETLSSQYFESDIEKIRQILNKLNRDLLSEMTLTMNDVYYELGLKPTKLGDMIGWHVNDGLIEPIFSSQLTDDGRPCLVMDFEVKDLRHLYTD